MAALTAYSCKMQQLWSSWMRTHWDTEVHKIEGHRFLYLLSVHGVFIFANYCLVFGKYLVNFCSLQGSFQYIVYIARAHNSTNYLTSSYRKSNNTPTSNSILFAIFFVYRTLLRIVYEISLATYLSGEPNFKTEMQLDLSALENILEILNAYKYATNKWKRLNSYK